MSLLFIVGLRLVLVIVKPCSNGIELLKLLVPVPSISICSAGFIRMATATKAAVVITWIMILWDSIHALRILVDSGIVRWPLDVSVVLDP